MAIIIEIGWDILAKKMLTITVEIEKIIITEFSLFKILTLEVKDNLGFLWSFYNFLIFSLQD